MTTVWVIFKARANKGVCLHGMVGCQCHYDLYYSGGRIWSMTARNAFKYTTKEAAELEAFLLVTKNGDYFGDITTKEMSWADDEDE